MADAESLPIPFTLRGISGREHELQVVASLVGGLAEGAGGGGEARQPGALGGRLFPRIDTPGTRGQSVTP